MSAPPPSMWPLGWLSAMAVDAPLVCVGWLWLLAPERSAARFLSEGIVLGLSVWLAYMADRWLDGWRLKTEDAGSFRHQFVRTNRATIGLIWSIILIINVTYAVRHLTTDTLRQGTVLLAVVVAYFVAIHLSPGWLRRSAPKEMATALILVLGILLFLPDGRIPTPALAAIALLFFSNCALIGEWESETESVSESGPKTKRISSSFGWVQALLAGTVGTSAIAVAGLFENEFRLAWMAVGLSSLLMLILDLTRYRLSLSNVRSMADITLMTPWVILLVGR
jgi:hypothetical protein